MILVKLMGGLGNQMFQYAFGKSLALKNNTDLKLDISLLNDRNIKGEYSFRDFSLNNFNIKTSIATKEECALFQKSKTGKIIDLLSSSLPVKSKYFYLREPSFSYYKKAMNAPVNTYADGYWQTEKYFNGIRKEILEEFSLSKSLSPQSHSLADKMRNEESVSIHVRRGDYLSIPQNNELYETCTESYYIEAIEQIKTKFPAAVFYVFSDEPEWFKKNVKTDVKAEYIVHNNGDKSYEDLILMSICKHNIIANSSFSWWGAWLNQNENKMVIAPKKWFKGSSKNTKDLLSEKWIQL